MVYQVVIKFDLWAVVKHRLECFRRSSLRVILRERDSFIGINDGVGILDEIFPY